MKTQKQILDEAINRVVKNVINEMFIDEKETEQPKKEKKNDDKDDRHAKNTRAATRRARVVKWLQDPTVNCAEIMRKLWKPAKKKEDAARSYFYKCRDGELNDSGVAYSFSDNDINRLYAIMNNLK